MAPKSGRSSTVASLACNLCRKKKRKCDGGQPCSICVKYDNADHCEYPVDKDRRKWKYDSSYVDYLEVKSDLLENFANELTKSDPEKAKMINAKLGLVIPQAPRLPTTASNQKLREFANPSALEEVISTAWRVREDRNGRTAFYGPISGRQQVPEDEEAEAAMQKTADGKIDVFSMSQELKTQLFDIFEANFAKYYYISAITMKEARTWDFPNKEPSKQFLLSSMFAYATAYTSMKNVSITFLAEAEAITLTACRNSLNEYVLQALLIISCFELGMAFDSSSWLFNAMCASQAQYLGLHLGDSSSDPFTVNATGAMVSTSPLRSATFWSIVMQDRLITSVLGRGSRVQYFRIFAPFYSPKLQDKSDPNYLSELVFTYHSRLWYIHDRSMSQIYSFKSQFLHNSHRHVLLKQGVHSLELLFKSFPDDIKLTNNPTDPRVLMLHLSYCVVLLFLHRPYLSATPEKVMEISVQQCVDASVVVDNFNKIHGFSTAPYFASYLILSCAMFELFVLSNKNESLKADARNRLDIFITALLEFGKVWRRGYKDLQVLSTLAEKWEVNHFFLKEAANMAELSSSKLFPENVETNLFEETPTAPVYDFMYPFDANHQMNNSDSTPDTNGFQGFKFESNEGGSAYKFDDSWS